MNLPNSNEGNWIWRYKPEVLTKDLALGLRIMTRLYGRKLSSRYSITILSHI